MILKPMARNQTDNSETKEVILPKVEFIEDSNYDEKALIAAGYVLEVTNREPDRISPDGGSVTVGLAYDRWHHPCMKGACTHKDTPLGHWKRFPAKDPSRVVS